MSQVRMRKKNCFLLLLPLDVRRNKEKGAASASASAAAGVLIAAVRIRKKNGRALAVGWLFFALPHVFPCMAADFFIVNL
jgi:hypothetical protein